MDKNIRLGLIILFSLLLLASIGSFIYGIYDVVEYQKAKSENIPDIILKGEKTEMVATLVIGIIGIIIFSFILYLMIRDNTKSFNTKFLEMFFVVFGKVLITLLFLASIGSIAYGGYIIGMSNREVQEEYPWIRKERIKKERKKGAIYLGVGIPGFIIFGLLYKKFVLRDTINGIKYIVS